ncbi:von Willebrand factor type A domain protein [compost metagenome]
MVNYFPYDWPRPQSADTPFRTTVTVTPTPWNAGTQLMSVAIKGYDIAPSSAPPANLVFLIDVSGSMNAPDKLPLLKSAFRLLLGKLRPEDKVSIVTYAGSAGTVLEPTSASERDTILNAIDTLQPGGSTAGAQGIEAAYDLARRAFIKDGVNRVMLATDGDFNVGASSDGDLKRLIEDRRRDGIYLSVLGFGEGNLNDSLMQTLAQNGNGTAAYIDTLAEAQKALVEEAGSTLFPIAKDVKIQVEFNPARIAEYRLIGYETRALRREDFNNDRVDAGDIGSGHAVTAIYEVTPKGSEAVLNDPLRYGKPSSERSEAPASDELAFVKLRYKQPDGDTSRLITTAVTQANAFSDFNAAPQDVRFATAVAAFGQKLRGAGTLEAYSYGSILDIARNARGEDPFGYRSGFLDLVRLADTLKR